jgi:chromosome segregation ATPase
MDREMEITANAVAMGRARKSIHAIKQSVDGLLLLDIALADGMTIERSAAEQQARRDALEAELKGLEEKLATRKAQIGNIETAIASAKRKAEEAEAAIAPRLAALREADAKLRDVQAQISAFETRAAEAAQKAKAAETDLAAKRAAVAGAEGKLDALKTEINALRAKF